MSKYIQVEKDALFKAISILDRDNLFITGGAGSGKSHLTREIISKYEEEGKTVVALGSTGVSAVNIGGFTLHSFFVFGISSNLEELVEYDRRNRSRLRELKKILKAVDLLIIDEISMVSSDLMDMIRYRLESLGFNGRVLIVGDFYQLPPIIKKRERVSLFDDKVYAFESDAWKVFNPVTLELIGSKRTDNPHFAQILSNIRKGILDRDSLDFIKSLLNKKIDNSIDYTWLFGRNIDVRRVNIESMALLPSASHSFSADIEVEKGIHQKRVDKWIEMLPADRELELKIGTPILFTVNRWGKYYNGERGILHSIDDDALIVEKDNRFVRVQKHEFEMLEPKITNEGIEFKPVATLSQFPVKPAYAVTIHKSQGMGIDYLVCNIDGLFAPSQFYVAISRATNPNNLSIEYSGFDFEGYLRRVIVSDSRVKEWEESLL